MSHTKRCFKRGAKRPLVPSMMWGGYVKMIRALWTAASGMQAQQLNIDVIANNLANVNTAGFKRSRADSRICCTRP